MNDDAKQLIKAYKEIINELVRGVYYIKSRHPYADEKCRVIIENYNNKKQQLENEHKELIQCCKN